jgi:hypothetical protein
MKPSLLVTLMFVLASPATAQTSIKGVELSPADIGRVQRQCNALEAKARTSLASEAPEEPAAGVIVSDPAGYWADSANAVDSTFAKVNLDTLTLSDCRKAGFH